MLRITDIADAAPIYEYCSRLDVPYFFPTSYEYWQESFERDVDGEGRPLFRELHGKAAYDGARLVGFIQYGFTAFGFDEQGEISGDISYPVIRSLYFGEGREAAGALLLEAAMDEFQNSGRTYAFFHYFGMSCYAHHGKLFEKFPWVEELLRQHGFVTEHENVYYSSCLTHCNAWDVELVASPVTAGGQQAFDFLLDGIQVGGCEVHDVSEKIAYLRWIYVNDEIQNRGVGSRCMAALKAYLFRRGFTRLDTDTALNNLRAQHFYEKNGFRREGITRSYFRDGECL